MRPLLLATLLLATPATADDWHGKTYIIQLSASQYASGYAKYLLPPLVSVLKTSGLRDARGPGADVAINVETDSDVGRWVGSGVAKVWTYTNSAMVGISPEQFVIADDGTPAFGIKAILQTPHSDSQAEMDCLIKLATQTALTNYRQTGIFQTDGSACLGR